MADWDGLRREIESAVTPPPLDALRRRKQRRDQRRTVAVSSALTLLLVASGVAVLGRRAQRSGPPRTSVAAGTAIDRVALGDRQPPPRDYADYVVTDVDFVSPVTGWAIGLRCVGDACDVATWRTTDGGRSWEPQVSVARGVPRAAFAGQDPTSGGGARALRMVTAREGFAFNPDLYVTHDGARTWERVPQPSKVAGVLAQGRSIWVFERGCPADDDCDAVLRTGTAGAGFALRTVPLPPTGGAEAVLRRAGEDVGYLLSWDAPDSPRSALRVTRDDGRAWTSAVNPCPDATAESLSAGAARPLWLVCTLGDAKRAFQSADRGATWRRLADPPAAGTVTDLIALSASTAYLTTQQPAALLVTRDGGATWAPAPGSARAGYGYGNLDVADATHAWAMGDAGILWRTTDGTTWERLTLPPGAPRATATVVPAAPLDQGVQFTGLFFLDPDNGWAVGRRCLAHTCSSVVRRTSDAGRTWRAAGAPKATWDDQQPLMSGEVRSVTFADARNGWLYNPGFWGTHDGGATWHDLGGDHVRQVVARDGAVWALMHHGCASMDCEPYVRRAEVGSDAFTGTEPSPTLRSTASLAVADGRTAYFVEEREDPTALLATKDGGRTWTRRAAPCDADARRLAAATAGTLWVLCGYGYEGSGGHEPHRTAVSTDGSVTWRTTAKVPDLGYLRFLVPFSATVAWRADAGMGEGIRYTSDGGRTWRASDISAARSGGAGALAFGMFDERHGWALFADDVVMRTRDGVMWERMTRP